MLKLLRLLVCLVVMVTSSMIILNPNSAIAKQKEVKIAKKESVVYVTRRGKKYHKETCPFIRNREAISIDEKEAIEKGLKPCSRCFSSDELI